MITLIPGLSPLINAILLALIVGTLVGFVTTLSVQSAGKARLNKRIALIAGSMHAAKGAGGKGTGQRRKMVQQKLKEIEDKAKAKKQNKDSLKELLIQANLDWTPTKFYIISAIVGVISTLLYILKGYPPIGAPLVLITMGLGAPRWFLKKKAAKRQKAFTMRFADAVDVIIRGIKSGLPVGECINMLGREMPEPIGLEFRLITEGQKLGMTLEEVLGRALVRMPTAELKFFAIVLAIQQQTGGNLADTLGKLTDVLRQRKKLKDKIQALSSEAKASAGIIGSLPFVVTLLLYLVNPTYLSPLFTESLGHTLIMIGFSWMGIGVGIMFKMINFDF